jgi:hypothetical protein
MTASGTDLTPKFGYHAPQSNDIFTPISGRHLHMNMDRSAISVCLRACSALKQSSPPVFPRRALTAASRSTGQRRSLHVTPAPAYASRPPASHDRGPKSDEDTQTDFASLDVLRNTAPPATGVDACTKNGFALNNQMRISGSGVLLVGGEAFRWRPWLREDRKEGTIAEGGVGDDAMTGRLQNAKGQWEVPDAAWGLLEIVWPKPGKVLIELKAHSSDRIPQISSSLARGPA